MEAAYNGMPNWARLSRQMLGAIMRALFITSNGIGDAVLSTGLLDNLINQNRKNLAVTLACGPEAAPLFSHMPCLERLIPLEKLPGSRHWLGLWRQVRRTQWDTVIDLRASALAYFLRARNRRVYKPRDDGTHRVLQLSQFLELKNPAAPRVWFDQQEIDEARHLLPDDRPILGIGPTANWRGKQWDAERFLELSARLTAPDGILSGARIAVFGAMSERNDSIHLLNKIPPNNLIDLVGRCDILTAAACLKLCSLFIGNDSGLMHLSSATNTPTLGLFGPSRDDLYAPWGDHCSVVRTDESFESLSIRRLQQKSTNGNLMNSLTVNKAESAAIELWRRLNPVTPTSPIESAT